MTPLFAIGVVTALLIGVGCRLLDLPLPAPPRWQGALLVVAMTLGFLLGVHLQGLHHAALSPQAANPTSTPLSSEPPP